MKLETSRRKLNLDGNGTGSLVNLDLYNHGRLIVYFPWPKLAFHLIFESNIGQPFNRANWRNTRRKRGHWCDLTKLLINDKKKI